MDKTFIIGFIIGLLLWIAIILSKISDDLSGIHRQLEQRKASCSHCPK